MLLRSKRLLSASWKRTCSAVRSPGLTRSPCGACTQGDGQFQRGELAALLIFLYPQAEPSEERIDELVERATRIESSSLTLAGHKNGSVSRSDLFATVMRYRDHLSEQKTLDDFFDNYDAVSSSLKLRPVLLFPSPS